MKSPLPYPKFIAEWVPADGKEGINPWLGFADANECMWAHATNWIESTNFRHCWRLRVEWLPAFLLWAHGRYSPEMFAQLQREVALRQIEEAQ